MQWRLNGPDKELFTKQEVAAYLQMRSTRALDRLIAAGQFPRGIPMGKRGPLMWTGLDIAAFLYLRGRTREGPADTDAEESETDEGP